MARSVGACDAADTATTGRPSTTVRVSTVPATNAAKRRWRVRTCTPSVCTGAVPLFVHASFVELRGTPAPAPSVRYDHAMAGGADNPNRGADRLAERRVSRRTLLGGGATLAAAGVLGPALLGRALAQGAETLGSGGTSIGPGVTEYDALQALGRATLRQPGSRPFPGLPEGTDTMPQIEHVVVLMMENHSFDNVFGMLGRGDGFALGANRLPTASNPYPDGSVQHAFHMPTTCQLSGSPSQEWTASHTAYDNGLMDGFVRAQPTAGSNAGVAMGYWTGADLPFTYSLASVFPIADRWFCSVLGQTDPNRRYVIAGTSAGMTDDVVPPADRRDPEPGPAAGDASPRDDLRSPQQSGHQLDRLHRVVPDGDDGRALPGRRHPVDDGIPQEVDVVLLLRRRHRQPPVLLVPRPGLQHSVPGEPSEHRRRRSAARGRSSTP